MKPKNIILILSGIAALIAIADLAAGNSNHPLLPEVVADRLDQQTDLVILVAGLGLGAFAYTQL